MEILERDLHDRIVLLGGVTGERSLTFLKANDTLAPGYHHVGLKVADPEDLAGSVTRARMEGIPIEADISHAGRRAVFLRDPDGFRVQLYSSANGEPALDRVDPALAAFVL